MVHEPDWNSGDAKTSGFDSSWLRKWRDGRVVEGTRLESGHVRKDAGVRIPLPPQLWKVTAQWWATGLENRRRRKAQWFDSTSFRSVEPLTFLLVLLLRHVRAYACGSRPSRSPNRLRWMPSRRELSKSRRTSWYTKGSPNCEQLKGSRPAKMRPSTCKPFVLSSSRSPASYD